MHAGGNVGRHVAQDRAFDRADVGHNRAPRKMRGDFRSDCATSADRNCDNDEVCAFRRRRVGFDHLISKAELGDAPAGRG